MANLRAANQIKQGDFIQTRDHSQILYYIQGVEEEIIDGSLTVTNYLALPIIDMPNAEDDIAGIISLPKSEIRDRDRTANVSAFVGISLNNGVHKIRPEDDFMENYVGSAHPEIQKEVGDLYEAMGLSELRFSDIPADEVRIRGMEWSNVADGGVKGKLALDGEERIQPKPTRKSSGTADSIPKHIDIYLEDAVKLGYLSFETYQILQNDRENIVTLRDAWALSQDTGNKPLSKIATNLNFDETFPAEKHHRKNDEVTDDLPISENSVVRYAARQNITLEDAVARGLISEKTLQTLSDQTNEDSDWDERKITHLEEAFRLVGADPAYLSEYDSPTSKIQLRTLTSKQQQAVVEDVKNAFNILSEQATSAVSSNELNAAMKKFRPDMLDLLRSQKAFMAPDRTKAVKTKIKQEVNVEIERIRSNRPNALTSSPT